MSFLSIFKKDVHHPSCGKKSHHIVPGNILQKNLVREFQLKLDEPHRIWKPDEYICGETILNIKKDVTNVALRLTLVSQVKVKSGVGATLRTKVTEKLLEKTTFLYGEERGEKVDANNATNGLTQGEHIFPFKLKIPSGRKVFSSIKFERGSITYFLQCSLESMGPHQAERPVSQYRQYFPVMVPLDVSNLPDPKTKTVVLQSTSSVRPTHKNSGDSSSSHTKATSDSNTSNNTANTSASAEKTVKVSVDVSRAGYCIGEIISIRVSLQHYKNFRHSAGLIVTLVRICRVGSGGKDEPMETFRKDICQTICPLYVDPETLECCVTAYLKVPIDAFSTFTSLQKFFTFKYYVEVMVNLSTKNVVLTESNRVVAGLHDVVKPTSNEPSELGDSIGYMPQKFIISKAGSEESFDESNIIYRDMVNVERLKRMNNVTGMSIETVIGMKRSEELSNPRPLTDVQQLEKCATSSNPQVDDWLAALDSYPPVPQYTPNNNVKTSEDKRELEQARLKQLESDPPLNNY
ncbi:RIM8 (YGL045W) [Zygosaccharomyces parabailii]|nr:RIM8 (YGL045W) [Zygosaccharomyces parabailii]